MSETLVIKNSMVPGKVPTNSEVQWGELALNIPDKIIYSMDVDGIVRKWNVTPEELQEALGNVNSVTDLSTSVGNDWMTISSSTGNTIYLLVATPLVAGLMSVFDKQKLDGVEAGAQVNPATTDSRVDTSTATVLQAKAMSDHVNSTDHDSRYYTKVEIDAMFAALTN